MKCFLDEYEDTFISSIFAFRSISSDTRIATPAFFLVLFTWDDFIYPFTLTWYLSLVVSYVSQRQQNAVHCNLMCLFASLLGNLRLLIFRITIQKCVLIPVKLLIFWCFLRSLLTSHRGIACLSSVVSYVVYPFHTKELLPGSSVVLE